MLCLVTKENKQEARKILFLNPEIRESEGIPFFRAPGALRNLISFTFGLVAGDSDLPHVTSVGEVVIARAQIGRAHV